MPATRALALATLVMACQGDQPPAQRRPGAVRLPRSTEAPFRPTTRPLTHDQLARLAAIEHADFERSERDAPGGAVEVRHTTRARPKLGVTVTIEPCGPCLAMDVARWQPPRDELARSLPPTLRDRPDTRVTLAARPIGGATAIALTALGAASGADEHGQPTRDYVDAYTLEYNDRVNRIRVTASYLDDAIGGVDGLVAIAPPEDLEKLAVAFLGFYVRQWR